MLDNPNEELAYQEVISESLSEFQTTVNSYIQDAKRALINPQLDTLSALLDKNEKLSLFRQEVVKSIVDRMRDEAIKRFISDAQEASNDND